MYMYVRARARIEIDLHLHATMHAAWWVVQMVEDWLGYEMEEIAYIMRAST